MTPEQSRVIEAAKAWRNIGTKGAEQALIDAIDALASKPEETP